VRRGPNGPRRFLLPDKNILSGALTAATVYDILTVQTVNNIDTD
jgi:hypothetical protein